MHIKLTADLREPHTHYIKVTYELHDIENDELILSFPVWSPGSYLVREYQSQIESLAVSNGGKKIAYEKISKNRWKIFCNGSKKIKLDDTSSDYRFVTSISKEMHPYLQAHLRNSGLFKH